jgi:hypothetical protein
MTNLEFVSMIDKLHEVKSDKQWKLYAILGLGGLLAITFITWKNGQKKGRELQGCRSEVEKVKGVAENLRVSYEQQSNTVAAQGQHIQKLNRENQDKDRVIASYKEKMNKENQPKS